MLGLCVPVNDGTFWSFICYKNYRYCVILLQYTLSSTRPRKVLDWFKKIKTCISAILNVNFKTFAAKEWAYDELDYVIFVGHLNGR